jgi:hypothetical protein
MLQINPRRGLVFAQNFIWHSTRMYVFIYIYSWWQVIHQNSRLPSGNWQLLLAMHSTNIRVLCQNPIPTIQIIDYFKSFLHNGHKTWHFLVHSIKTFLKIKRTAVDPTSSIEGKFVFVYGQPDKFYYVQFTHKLRSAVFFVR